MSPSALTLRPERKTMDMLTLAVGYLLWWYLERPVNIEEAYYVGA